MILLRIFLIVILGVAVRICTLLLSLPGIYGPEGDRVLAEDAKQKLAHKDANEDYKSYAGFILFSVCIIILIAMLFFLVFANKIDNRHINIVLTSVIGILIGIYVVWTIRLQKMIRERIQQWNQKRSQDEKDGSTDSSPISWFRASKEYAFGIAGTWTFFLLLFASMVFLIISPGYRIVDGDTLVIQRKAVLIEDNRKSFEQFKSIKIECALEEIPKDSFDYCSKVECIEIPEGTVGIGEDAFSNCQALQEIRLPDGLRKIGDSAFHGCSALKEVSLSPELMVLGTWAFSYCHSLEEVTIRGDIRDVGSSIFYKSPVHVIRIEEGTTIVNSAVFEDCVELKKVYLPASLRQFNIDRWHPLFADCSALETICYAGSEAQWKELTKDIDGIDPGITVITGSAG